MFGADKIVKYSFDYFMIFIYYTRTMQKVRIPQMVDPVRSAAKRLTYKGIIPKEKLLRLSDIVKILTDIDVELSFSVDLQGMTVIEGNVGTSVKCECQRCGELFNFDIETDLVYSSDEEKAKKLGLFDNYDFISQNEFGEVDLYNMIEDELILSLPTVIMHEECEDEAYGSEVYVSGKIEEKPTPFAVLSVLKSKK